MTYCSRLAGLGRRGKAATAILALIGTPALAKLPVDFAECAAYRTNPELAIVACSRIIQSGRTSQHNLVLTYFNRGNAYSKLKNPDSAISDFDQAVRIEPAFVPAYNARAVANMNKGNLDRAISDANTAIERNASFSFAFGTRGTAYQRKCELDRAKSDLDEAIRLNPQLAPAYNIRGIVYMNMHDLGEAASNFEQAIRLDPNLAPAYVNLGILSGKTDTLERAINYYDQAIQIDPKHAFTYVMRGNAYEKKHSFERAMADFNSAIQLDDKLAAAYYERGYARLQERQNPDLAISDLDRAIKLDPTHATAFTARGLAYEQKGNQSQAKADFNTGLAIPLKCGSDSWAHDTARARLAALATKAAEKPQVATPRNQSTQPNSVVPPKPALPPPTSSEKSLRGALAECTKHSEGLGPFTLPGAKGEVKLDVCWRGLDYLNCVRDALLTEAKSIDQSYKEVVEPQFIRVDDVSLVCRVTPEVLNGLLKKAGGFDSRWETLSADYDAVTTCVDKVRDQTRDVVFLDMPNGADIAQSIRKQILDAVEAVSETQKEVSKLAVGIDQSRRALNAFKQIRQGGMCPRNPSH